MKISFNAMAAPCPAFFARSNQGRNRARPHRLYGRACTCRPKPTPIDRPSHLLEITSRQWRALLRDAARDAGRDNLGLVAAGVAFFALMAVFPSLAAVVAMYGLLGDPAGVGAQIDALSGVAPAPVAQPHSRTDGAAGQR
ncbi:MAG: hypothetical protein WDN76_06980 [Alphaproteobacteria bacterium]